MLLTHTKRGRIRSQAPLGTRWRVERRENFISEYDADGNQTLVQTSTGIWHVTYNAQNRAVKFESVDGSTIITCAYDYMGRRYEKQVISNGTITTHQRFIYRNYLQIAAVNLKANASTPDLWFLIWDPTQPVATRPLAIRKDGTWYTYGWDLTKNVCELYGQQGYIRTIYRYSPYGTVIAEDNVEQVIQWSSEYYGSETSLTYYNYRYYNPLDGRWTRRDPLGKKMLYDFVRNNSMTYIDNIGLYVNVDTDKQNCLIIITFNILIYPSKTYGPTSQELNKTKEKILKAIETYWNDSEHGGKDELKYGCCKITAKGDVRIREDINDTPWFTFKDWNKIRVTAQPYYRSNTYKTEKEGDRHYGNWKSDTNPKTYAHEIGHLAGLEDDYEEVTDENGRKVAVSKPGHENHLMSTGDTLAEHELQEVLKGVNCPCNT